MAKFKRIKQIAEEFDNSICILSDDELRKIIRECRKLSRTNCWFLEYELKDIVISRAKAFLETRRRKSNSKKGKKQ